MTGCHDPDDTTQASVTHDQVGWMVSNHHCQAQGTTSHYRDLLGSDEIQKIGVQKLEVQKIEAHSSSSSSSSCELGHLH